MYAPLTVTVNKSEGSGFVEVCFITLVCPALAAVSDVIHSFVKREDPIVTVHCVRVCQGVTRV
jgi:hypothetical protein